MDGPHLLAHGEQCNRTGWFTHYTFTAEQLALSALKAVDKLAAGQSGGARHAARALELCSQ